MELILIFKILIVSLCLWPAFNKLGQVLLRDIWGYIHSCSTQKEHLLLQCRPTDILISSQLLKLQDYRDYAGYPCKQIDKTSNSHFIIQKTPCHVVNTNYPISLSLFHFWAR